MNTQQMMEEIDRLARLCEAKDAEIERWKEAASDLGRCFDSSNKRIADIERKLSEQTVFADKYAREVIEAQAMIAMQAEALKELKASVLEIRVPQTVSDVAVQQSKCNDAFVRVEKALSASAESVAAWRVKETEPLRREVVAWKEIVRTIVDCEVPVIGEYTLDSVENWAHKEFHNMNRDGVNAYEREVKAKVLEEAASKCQNGYDAALISKMAEAIRLNKE
jgi:hypothetical protein